MQPKDTNPQIAKIHLLKAKKATIRWDRGIFWKIIKKFYKYFWEVNKNFTDKTLFNIYSYDIDIFYHILKTINGGNVHSDQMTVNAENNFIAKNKFFYAE